jgi:hypothetical protein
MLFVFTYSCFQQKCNIIWCSCHLTVTRRMPLVEQEHLMLPDHMSSPSPWWGSCFYFCFLCSIRQQLFVYLFFFFVIELLMLVTRLGCCPIRTHYPDSEPTSLCSLSLMLHSRIEPISTTSTTLEASTLTITQPMLL